MLAEWLQALQNWEVAAYMRRSVYVYPLLNATHIFALTLLVGGILPADLRMLGLFRSVAIAPFVRLMTSIAASGLALAIATGLLLFSVQPLEYAGNRAFLVKVSLVAFGAVLALAVRFSGPWRTFLATGEVGALRVTALLSLAIWLSALIAGRWIAFL
jgi:hypothetical protein